jgi:hypothetical protein
MRVEKASISFLILFLLVGAILCSALGVLIVKFIPQLGIITQNLTGPVGFNLEIISFSLTLNLSAIVGIVLGYIVFRKV